MSVGASLGADAVAVARLNQNQALSDVHGSAAESSADALQGTKGLNFSDSLRAHLDSPGSEEGLPKPEVNTVSTGSRLSSPPAVTNTTERTNPNQGFAHVAANQAGPRETVLAELTRNSRAKLTTPIAVQKQSFDIIGYRAAAATSAKKSTSAEAKDSDANDVAAVPVAMAVPSPICVVATPNQNAPISSAIIASDPVQNSSTSSTITGTISASRTVSQDGHAQNEDSNGWQSTDSNVQLAVCPVDGRMEGHEANNEDPSEVVADHVLFDQTRSLVSSGLNTSAGLDGGRFENGASNDVMPAAGIESEQQTSFEVSARTGAKQGFATSPPLSSATEHPSRSIGADDGSVQSAPNAATLEAVPVVKHRADSKVSLQAASSRGVVETIGASKSSSLRFAPIGAHSQDLKSGLANSADALAVRIPDISRITEATNGGSANQKITDAPSSDSRLQDAFSALEPGARNDAGAFNWARAGHMQAEAGYQDPALGWIGIRAEASGGAVHAMLVPQSSDAAQVLSGHVAGLHSYLAENHTPVETLTLSSFGGNAQQFTGQHSGQGTHQGSEQHAGQDNAPGAAPEPQSIIRAVTGNDVRKREIAGESFTRSNGGFSSGGAHISVLA